MTGELDRQIKETKIECLDEFRISLLLRLKSDEHTQIYKNFVDYVSIITKEMIQEEKERLGL